MSGHVRRRALSQSYRFRRARWRAFVRHDSVASISNATPMPAVATPDELLGWFCDAMRSRLRGVERVRMSSATWSRLGSEFERVAYGDPPAAFVPVVFDEGVSFGEVAFDRRRVP